MSENLTVTVHKAKDLRIDETPIPEPKDDEVLIKMDSVGICGSDVHFWQDGGFGELIVKTPTYQTLTLLFLFLPINHYYVSLDILYSL